MAIHKLGRLLDGFSIAGIFDGFHWTRNMVGAVVQIDAIWGHGGYSLQYRRERYSALSHRRLAQSHAGDASYVGCSTQLVQCRKTQGRPSMKEAAHWGSPNTYRLNYLSSVVSSSWAAGLCPSPLARWIAQELRPKS